MNAIPEVKQLNKKRAFKASLSIIHEEGESLMLDKTMVKQIFSSDKKPLNKSTIVESVILMNLVSYYLDLWSWWEVWYKGKHREKEEIIERRKKIIGSKWKNT